jgi:YhcH/YjgK/YiaL family protein
MILDKISNFEQYKFNSNQIYKALKLLFENEFADLDPGKYVLDGDRLFYMVNEYETTLKDSNELEFHKKYIDVQFMLKGSEIIKHKLFEDEKPSKEYSSDNDFGMAKVKKFSKILLTQGDFAIFYPNDLHMPGFSSSEKASKIKKIVFKIQIQ